MENNKIATLLIVGAIAIMVMPVMGIAPPGNTVTSNVTVGNVAPDVCGKWEEPDDDVADGIQVTPNQCPDTKTVTIYACVCDGNGNDDISNVSAEVKYANETTKTTVALSINSSVDCGECSCIYSDIECVGYSGTFDMGCCDPAGIYTVNVTVTDASGKTDSMENTFEYLSLIAMTASDVNFGSVAPGGSGTANSTIIVYGNNPIKFVDVGSGGYDNPDPDDGIVWSDMTSGGNSIPDDQISTTWNPATCVAGCFGTAYIPFTLSVPEGTPNGVYTGTITFTPSHC